MWCVFIIYAKGNHLVRARSFKTSVVNASVKCFELDYKDVCLSVCVVFRVFLYLKFGPPTEFMKINDNMSDNYLSALKKLLYWMRI